MGTTHEGLYAPHMPGCANCKGHILTRRNDICAQTVTFQSLEHPRKQIWRIVERTGGVLRSYLSVFWPAKHSQQ